MRKFILSVVAIVVCLTIAAIYNHFDVQARGNGPDFDPSVKVLRTPDQRFTALTDFPFEPNYIEIEDDQLGTLRIHYLDEGPENGEVIVLMHGQATWSYSYRDFIPVLVDAGYRVIVPDMVGFGRSDKPADWEAHTYAKHIDWLAATLKALQINDATGFLFDWGGYFGIPVAVQNPDMFSRLALVVTLVPRGNSVVGALWTAGWRRYILKPEIFPISGMVSDMTTRELESDTITGLDAPYPDERYKGGPRRMPMMIPATFFHPAHTPNLKVWEQLAQWNKPTMTLVGKSLSERGFNPKEFHDQIPGSKGMPHAIYPDTGFFLIEENPEELARQTIKFIQASPAS